MQLTQTLADGLKRQYKVSISAADLTSRFNTELEGMRGRVNLNGFRPGKVPVAHLKRVYGRSIMAEVVQNTVTDANRKIAEEAGTRLASEPKVNFPEDEALIDKVLKGESDLDFAVDVEILPKIEIADHSGITLVRETAEVPEADIEDAITRMAAAQRSFSPRASGEAAMDGDKVTIDFAGSINGIPFDGGTAEGADLVLGSGQFIPGFEAQLVGAKPGESRVVKVTFPETYQSVDLAGKAAEFAVTVHAIQAPGDAVLDDELAKRYGLETLAAMRDAVRQSMADEIAEQSRQKMKRQLLDALDEVYTFDLPPTMLEQEFAAVWGQIEADMKREGKSFADDAAGEAEARAEYRKIAARRVRLGLVLAEIGERAEVKVSDDEITQALISRARQFPGQEKMVFDYYRKNPQAMAEIRAPLFEEKVVDHILAGLTITEKTTTRAALLSGDEAGAATEEKAEKPKKAKAKKAE